MRPEGTDGKTDRRSFCKGVAVVAFGGVAVAAPVGASLRVLLGAGWETSHGGETLVRVAPLEAVPGDGTPAKFPVIAPDVDAWSKSPDAPIGSVYLRRVGADKIEALNAICPHAGGLIDIVDSCFLCPLHKSQFNFDGSVKDPSSPAPRPMDSLETEIREGVVWVRFENFRPGTAQKTPA